MKDIRTITLIGAIALLSSCDQPAARQFATVEDAAKLGNFARWKLVQKYGDEQGPFTHAGRDSSLNANAGKKVFFMLDGVRHEREVDIDEEVLVGVFENAKGNTLLLLFTRDGKRRK